MSAIAHAFIQFEITYLVTKPIDTPVNASHIHQSKEKELQRSELTGRDTQREHVQLLLVVELGQAEDGKECEEEQHRVEQYKP